MTPSRQCLVGLIVLCILCAGAGSQAHALPSAFPAALRPQVTSTDGGLILDWRAPDVQLAPHADGTFSILLPGYSQTSQPGMLQLPFASALVALPPDAAPTVRVLLIEEAERPLPGPLALAPIPEGVQRDATGHPIGGAFSTASPTDNAKPAEVSPTMNHRADNAKPAEAGYANEPGGAFSLVSPTMNHRADSAKPAEVSPTMNHRADNAKPAEAGYSDEPVVLEPAGIVRGVRLARVMFYPVRPVGDRLLVTTHVRVSVTFDAAPRRPGALSQEAGDPLLAAVRSAVVNPDQVQPSAAPAGSPQPGIHDLQSQAGSRSGSASVAIEVNAAGLTAVTYEALLNAGFPVGSTDPHTLHLARDGQEVAIEWDGDDDASLEPGERLLFYADPRPGRWTPADVYFLGSEAAPGLRMSSRSADPAGRPAGIAWTVATAEVNALYTPDCFCKPISPGRDGDRWTWDDLRRPGHETASYSIRTLAVDATRPATLTLWAIGYTGLAANPDHRLDIALNGAWLGRVEWDGKTAITATLSIPAGVLRSDENTLALTLPGIPGVSVDGMWLDALAVRFSRGLEPAGAMVAFGAAPAASPAGPGPSLPNRLYLPVVMRGFPGSAPAYTVALASPGPYRAYDVTDALHPQRLTGVQVDGSTLTLADPAEGGARRYVVAGADGIASPASVRAVQNPWTFHAGVPVTGTNNLIIAHPAFAGALAPLVSLRQSQGLATAVVNVLGIYDAWGDGRPDPATIRAFIADAYATWNPRPTHVLLVGDGSFDPKRYRLDSPATFIPPYLADVDPWTSETAADNRYVTVDGDDNLPDMLIGRLPVKTLAEAQAVVDKIVRYETQPLPGGWNADVALVADNTDSAGDFTAEAEIIATHYITAPFVPQRIYYTPPAVTVAATQQAALNRWNVGALMIQFTGHSSWQQWAAERLFHLDDLAALHNDRRWPVVVEMTCFTSAFQRPEPTLDKALVTLSGGGAVAAWGATGLGVGTGHHALAEGFYQAVLHTPANTLGEAALAGKLSLAATHSNLDLLDTFTLLGDPATRLDLAIVPWASHTFLPIMVRR